MLSLVFPSNSKKSLLFVLALSSLQLGIHAAGDTIKPGEAISGNQTIVSSGGTFSLGFFKPGKSPTSYFLGVWYNTEDKAVVWVANRENPLTDTSEALTLDTDDNLVIRDGNRNLVWSSNATNAANGSEAVLSGTGNLVLKLGGNTLWQSFVHPTHTLLPNMKLTSDYRTGVATPCVSWKAADDPSPGSFSFGIDPRTSIQQFIWRGSEPYYRTKVWNGTAIFAEPVNNETTTSIYLESMSLDDDRISWWYTVSQDLGLTRFVLEETGIISLFTWDTASRRWIRLGTIPSLPSSGCEVYNQCGPNGVCDGKQSTLSCKCLTGYLPKTLTEWNSGNFSGGCVRAEAWDCSRSAYYEAYSKMKLPDGMTLIKRC